LILQTALFVKNGAVVVGNDKSYNPIAVKTAVTCRKQQSQKTLKKGIDKAKTM
jgi:hypothetical protein